MYSFTTYETALLRGLKVLAVNETPRWIEVVARYEDEEAIWPGLRAA